MKKILYILIIVLVLAGAGYGVYRWQNQKSQSSLETYQVVAAERGELVATIGATGIVRSNQTARLAWTTSGTVDTVNVQVGEKVTADQILANLSQTSLPQNVIMAEVELNSAQKALDDLYTTAETAKVNAMQAIVNYAKAVKAAQYQLDNFTIPAEQADMDAIEALEVMEEKLNQAREAFEPYKFYPSSDPTRQQLKEALDEAQSDYNTAVKRLEYEYDLDVAKANLNKAKQDYKKWKDGPDETDIASAKARIAAAQATLNTTRIAAPFGGTITNVNIKPGDQVSPGTFAFQIDDLSHLLVDVNVSEIDINRVQPGQDVKISFDAILGKEYNGVVTEVDRIGTSVQGVVDFIVTVELTDTDEDVKPGMTAAVNIVVDKLENVLLIPNRAVRVRDGNRTVFVLKNDQLVPVEITLGASSEIVSEVLEGEIKEGDSIVLNPPLEFNSNGGPPFMGGR